MSMLLPLLLIQAFFHWSGHFCFHNPERTSVLIPRVRDWVSTTMSSPTYRQLTLFDIPEFFSHKGEGSHASTHVGRADNWQFSFVQEAAKCGIPPKMSSGSDVPGRFSSVQKRSFKRACRRAIVYGSTRYHGRLVMPTDFPSSLVQKMRASLEPVQSQRVMPRPYKHSPRLTVFYWNAGGLSQSTFVELQRWLRIHPTHVAVICETRWSFEGTWTTDEWSFVHTATMQHRSGGILVMVARSMVSPEQLGYDVVVPGRLIQVR